MGYRQTVQIKMRRRMMRRLIRVNSDCLKDISIAVKIMQINNSDTPKKMNELQLIRMEYFTQDKWVKGHVQSLMTAPT